MQLITIMGLLTMRWEKLQGPLGLMSMGLLKLHGFLEKMSTCWELNGIMELLTMGWKMTGIVEPLTMDGEKLQGPLGLMSMCLVRLHGLLELLSTCWKLHVILELLSPGWKLNNLMELLTMG